MKLQLGNNIYTDAQVNNLLDSPVQGNALLSLLDQLIAAKLNVLDGADGSQISDDIADQTSTQKSLGKDVHRDDGKCTIPQKFGINRSISLRMSYAERANAQLLNLPFSTEDLVRLATKIIHG